MSKIEGLVKIVWKPENEKTKLSRTWASIRLAFHKEDIEEFEAQLARAIFLLDFSTDAESNVGCHVSARFSADFCSSVHHCATALVLDMSNTTRAGLSFSIPTSCNMSNKTHRTAHLFFYYLTDESHHLVTLSGSYWRHLTVDALHIYTKVYEACKDENENVSCK
jgi:hypothetical protein